MKYIDLIEVDFVRPEGDCKRIFPDEVENDELIYFHGTDLASFAEIKINGFKKNGILDAVSYSKNSAVALGYACQKRDVTKNSAVVLASKVDCSSSLMKCLDKSILAVGHAMEQPKVIMFCVVDDDYKHQ